MGSLGPTLVIQRAEGKADRYDVRDTLDTEQEASSPKVNQYSTIQPDFSESKRIFLKLYQVEPAVSLYTNQCTADLGVDVLYSSIYQSSTTPH